MLEFLTGCLEIWNIKTDGKNIPFLAITPNFIATLEGDFKDNIVYIKSPNSSVFQKSFLEKKTHSFFGFTGRSIEFIPFATLFTSMIMNTEITSWVSGKAEAEWKKMKDGAKDLAKQTNSLLLVDDADFILLGNNSLNPGGGYAPGGVGFLFLQGQ